MLLNSTTSLPLSRVREDLTSHDGDHTTCQIMQPCMLSSNQRHLLPKQPMNTEAAMSGWLMVHPAQQEIPPPFR